VVRVAGSGIELERCVHAASDADIMRDQLEFLLDECHGNKAADEDFSRLNRVRQILMEPFATE